MLFICYASSYMWGRVHQAFVRGQQAVKYNDWQHNENYVAGETNLGRVQVMTHAYPMDTRTNALHKEHNVRWTYGTVRLFKEVQSPSSVNPGIKVIKTIYLEIDMEPEYTCTGFGTMGLPMFEPKTTASSGVPTTVMKAACMLRLDSVHSHSPSVPVLPPNDGPYPGGPYPPAVSVSAGHRTWIDRNLQQQVDQKQEKQEVRDSSKDGPTGAGPSDEASSGSRLVGPPQDDPTPRTRQQETDKTPISRRKNILSSGATRRMPSPFRFRRTNSSSGRGGKAGKTSSSKDQTPPVTRSQTERRFSDSEIPSTSWEGSEERGATSMETDEEHQVPVTTVPTTTVSSSSLPKPRFMSSTAIGIAATILATAGFQVTEARTTTTSTATMTPAPNTEEGTAPHWTRASGETVRIILPTTPTERRIIPTPAESTPTRKEKRQQNQQDLERLPPAKKINLRSDRKKKPSPAAVSPTETTTPPGEMSLKKQSPKEDSQGTMKQTPPRDTARTAAMTIGYERISRQREQSLKASKEQIARNRTEQTVPVVPQPSLPTYEETERAISSSSRTESPPSYMMAIKSEPISELDQTTSIMLDSTTSSELNFDRNGLNTTMEDCDNTLNPDMTFNPFDQSVIGVSMLPDIEQIQRERAEQAARIAEEEKFFEPSEIKMENEEVVIKTEPDSQEIPFPEDYPVPPSSPTLQIKQEEVSDTENEVPEEDGDQGEPEETGGEPNGGAEL